MFNLYKNKTIFSTIKTIINIKQAPNLQALKIWKKVKC